ncbi:hypothetical protein AB0C51_21425 [Streptomyces pathocidini]|uniref:hypothetical protein n=1 Tax=Streptomyces pathocidini TaxID=1650571 RepID=UPI0034083153
MFVPAGERPWRDAWPLAAQVGDGNAWLTGACWLFCRRAGVAVLWVGSVTTPGATGDAYACGPCIAELDHMVRVQAHDRDGHAERAGLPATLAVPAHAPSPRPLPTEGSGGRHRAPHRGRFLYGAALPVGVAP